LLRLKQRPAVIDTATALHAACVAAGVLHQQRISCVPTHAAAVAGCANVAGNAQLEVAPLLHR
jgi:hypothetical protein